MVTHQQPEPKKYWVFPRLEASFIGFGLCVALALNAYFLYQNGKDAQQGEFVDGIERYAQMMAAIVDPSSHGLLKAGEEQTPLYQESIDLLRRSLLSSCRVRQELFDTQPDLAKAYQLELIQATHAKKESGYVKHIFNEISKGGRYHCDIAFIYTATIDTQDQVHFVLDPWAEGIPNYQCMEEVNRVKKHSFFDNWRSNKNRQKIQEITKKIADCPEMKSNIGSLYDDPSFAMLEAFHKQEITITKAPYHDAWGDFFSVYAPFYDKKGAFIGLVGIDIDASSYIKRFKPIKRAAYRSFVSAFFLAYTIAAMVWFLRYGFLKINQSRISIYHSTSKEQTGSTQSKDNPDA